MPLVTPRGGEPLHDWYYLLNALGLLKQELLFVSMTRELGALSMLIFLITGSYQVWLMIRLPKGDSDSPSEEEFENNIMGGFDE